MAAKAPSRAAGTDAPLSDADLIALLEELDIAEVRAAAWLDRNANQITGMPHGHALSQMDMAVDPLRRCILAVRKLRKAAIRERLAALQRVEQIVSEVHITGCSIEVAERRQSRAFEAIKLALSQKEPA